VVLDRAAVGSAPDS